MRIPLDELSGRRFDVAVIGAGINGCAAAQELAGGGYLALLVDKGDFGAGSSGRSTRLLHCGLRYLAPGRFPYQWIACPGKLLAALSMARASMRAREEFVLDAPERVRKMTFGFPVRQGMQYRPWHVDLGLRVVAAFGSAIVFPNSTSTRPGASRRIRRASKRHTSSHIGSAGNHLTTMLAQPDFSRSERRSCRASFSGASVRAHVREQEESHSTSPGRSKSAPATGG